MPEQNYIKASSPEAASEKWYSHETTNRKMLVSSGFGGLANLCKVGLVTNSHSFCNCVLDVIDYFVCAYKVDTLNG